MTDVVTQEIGIVTGYTPPRVERVTGGALSGKEAGGLLMSFANAVRKPGERANVLQLLLFDRQPKTIADNAAFDDLGPVQIIADRLMTLYPDENSLRRILALAKVEAVRIPFDGRAANMAWFAAVEAARQARLADLVAVMLEEYPLEPWLVGIHGKLLRSK